MLGKRVLVASMPLWAAAIPINAEALAQRTFVSSTGVDSHPCNLAQPCRSFASAIAQTDIGGEVIVLDSAGYGPVTITQSVSNTKHVRTKQWRGGPLGIGRHANY